MQDGAEPSAASITLYNLQRLEHFAEDRHAEYQDKAQSILKSNSQLLEQAPFALGTMVSAGLIGESGYRQVCICFELGVIVPIIHFPAVHRYWLSSGHANPGVPRCHPEGANSEHRSHSLGPRTSTQGAREAQLHHTVACRCVG